MEDNKRIIVTASAAERDYFFIADTSAAAWQIDPFEPDQVYRIYDSQHPGLWHITPVNRCIVSICRYTYPDRDRTIFVTLSAEGEVGFVGKQEGFTEKIHEAGLHADDAKGYGYMRAIRQIGTDLFACGHSGQVYRRTSPGTWQHVDAGLLLPIESNDVLMLEDIRGTGPDRLFVAASNGLHFSDGKGWHRLALPADEWLHAVLIEDADTVWACGRNGTLLKGNERQGFADLSRIEDNETFLSIARYGDRIYLGHDEGVSIFDGKKIDAVPVALKPKLRDGHLVEAVDGVLWSFGYSDIARFDGTSWKRYPTNKP